MSNKSVFFRLLTASLFSSLVLTGAPTKALAKPLRTPSPTQPQVRPGLNPASATDLITPSEPEDLPQVRPDLNPNASPRMQTQSGNETTAPVAWPPGPPCDSDILPPGHWGAPCIIRAVGDDPFN